MSRLTIEVTPKQHQHIKSLAAFRGQTIKEYVLSRIFPDDEDHAYKEFKAFMHNRIAEAEKGELSERSLEDITKDVLSDSH
ncbi:MAG: antitoxin [Saprospiraceae bacterium]|nr:antitoxin [Saprospiraceae bacterium]